MPHTQCRIGTACSTTWSKRNIFPQQGILCHSSSRSLAQLQAAHMLIGLGTEIKPKCWRLVPPPPPAGLPMGPASFHLPPSSHPTPCITLPRLIFPGGCSPQKAAQGSHLTAVHHCPLLLSCCKCALWLLCDTPGPVQKTCNVGLCYWFFRTSY